MINKWILKEKKIVKIAIATCMQHACTWVAKTLTTALMFCIFKFHKKKVFSSI
jgi:hypothetical protein